MSEGIGESVFRTSPAHESGEGEPLPLGRMLLLAGLILVAIIGILVDFVGLGVDLRMLLELLR